MSLKNKEKKEKSLLNKIGMWVFIFGIALFILGLILLFATVSFSFGIIIASIIINVIGITLLTTKSQAA